MQRDKSCCRTKRQTAEAKAESVSVRCGTTEVVPSHIQFSFAATISERVAPSRSVRARSLVPAAVQSPLLSGIGYEEDNEKK